MQESQQKFIELIEEFIERINPDTADSEIEHIISTVSQMLGYDNYSFMSGSVFGGRIITGWDKNRPHRFINFDKGFIDEYSSKRMDKHDLVLIQGMNAWQPFEWSNALKKENTSKEQADLKSLSSDFGMREGIVFPTQGFGDDISLFSLSTSKESQHNEMPVVIQSLVLMLINKIHFSVKMKYLQESPTKDKKLSARELDVLLWLKEGKTFWEIGQILGISEHTVDTHLRRAKAKLNVTTKEQAIAKTITIRLTEPI